MLATHHQKQKLLGYIMMQICRKFVRALAVVLLAMPHVVSQNPELSSTLYSTIDGSYEAFSNETVTFTCIARGSVSSHIGWSSEQYIGTGGRGLEFIAANPPRTTRVIGNAVAVLVDAVVDDFIESRLYIRIHPNISVASVQCLNIDAGTMTSISFHLADNDISIACDKPSVCPGEAVTCVCATGNSNTLTWTIDENRLEFASNDRLLTRHDVNAFGFLTNRSNENRVHVITSNLTVTASMDDTRLQVQCRNVDRSTSSLTTIPVLQNCTTPTVTEPIPGSNATTCMGNGEWEPDPREVECKGIEGEKIEESRSTVLTTALSSTVVVFLVISLLTFVAGFACGHYFGRKRTKATSSQPVALYEDVNMLPSAVEHQEQHLELKENVAYGPLKSTEQH